MDVKDGHFLFNGPCLETEEDRHKTGTLRMKKNKKAKKKKVRCHCPACKSVQWVDYSPIISGTMKCKKCTADFQAVPTKRKNRTEGMDAVLKPFVKCRDCNKEISRRADECPSCGSPTANRRIKYRIKQNLTHRKKLRWTLCAASILIAASAIAAGIGFFHVITGSNLESSRIVRKDSFGYSETVINIDKITGMPWVFARSNYPLGCKVLQAKGHIETDEAFQRRIKRQFAQLQQ